MMEQAQTDNRYATRPMTDEEIAFEKLTKQVEKLEKIVGALAVTNFLTQHEDGDEEVRDQSVEAVNRFSQRFKHDWKNERKIAELEAKKYELDQEINGLKWGVKLSAGNYATQIGASILNTKNAVTSNLMNTTIALDLQQERMNAFNASAARAEAVGILKESK